MNDNKEQELIFCIAMLFDDLQKIVERYPNNKPLMEMTKDELLIENADICLGIVSGILEENGIFYKEILQKLNNNEL